MKLAVAADHGAFELKESIKKHLKEKGIEYHDFGCYSKESVDYPRFAYYAASAVAKGECDRGIFVDGVGYGSAMISNKISGIYACVCQDPFCAQLARQHNDANVLCLGAKIIGGMIAMEIVKTYMSTEPLTAEKYVRRVKKVQKINDEYCVPVK